MVAIGVTWIIMTYRNSGNRFHCRNRLFKVAKPEKFILAAQGHSITTNDP
jgi:hypothetical protein